MSHEQNFKPIVLAADELEPVIQRDQAWRIPAVEPTEFRQAVQVRDEQEVITLEVVPVAIDQTPQTATEVASDPEMVNRQREAAVSVISRLLNKETAVGSENTDTTEPKIWVGWDDKHVAKLSDVVITSAAGRIEIEVIDKEGNPAIVPSNKRVMVLEEHKPHHSTRMPYAEQVLKQAKRQSRAA